MFSIYLSYKWNKCDKFNLRISMPLIKMSFINQKCNIFTVSWRKCILHYVPDPNQKPSMITVNYILNGEERGIGDCETYPVLYVNCQVLFSQFVITLKKFWLPTHQTSFVTWCHHSWMFDLTKKKSLEKIFYYFLNVEELQFLVFLEWGAAANW